MRKPLLILIAILSAVMLLAVACGGDEADPNATATPAPPNTVAPAERTPEPTVAPTAVPATTAPATSAPATSAGPVQLDIDVNGDALQFNTNNFSASAGAEVVVTFNNSSGVNFHNFVLVQPGTKDAVAADGTAAGPANDWVPPGDSRVIANTVLISPGESAKVTFTAPPAGTYQFVCTFPGHNFTMFGDFIVN
ncbi:MAG: azurin [Chloroflexi bacterium]|nr:azurin [Chloroflexota bacterium]